MNAPRSLVLLLALGCRLNPECFGNDECQNGLACGPDGRCVDPSMLPDDAGRLYTWYNDIEPLVTTYCRSCHGQPQLNNAPMPLLTYEDTTGPSANGEPMYRAMARRVGDVNSPMPPRGQVPLSLTQIAAFRRWSEQGGPPGIRRPDAGVGDVGNPGNNPLNAAGPVTMVVSGYQRIYATVWAQGPQQLYFSDLGGNGVYALTPGIGAVATPLRIPSEQTAGIRIDGLGQLLMSEQATGQLVAYNGQDALPILTGYLDAPFNSPGAVAVRADGTIYLTDPPLMGDRAPAIGFSGVYRYSPNGQLTVEWRGLPTTRPVGIELSATELVLYVSDNVDSLVRAFSVAPDGALVAERPFALTGAQPAGMTVDVMDNLYVATAGGVEVYNRVGYFFGTLPTPEPAQAVAFGGPARDTLFVVSATSVYQATFTGIQGAR